MTDDKIQRMAEELSNDEYRAHSPELNAYLIANYLKKELNPPFGEWPDGRN